MPITDKVVNNIPVHVEVYLIQLYVMLFVSDQWISLVTHSDFLHQSIWHPWY